MSETPLRRALQARHLTMIAIGGTIGAGLFVGSGPVIASAGPAAILSYVAGGVIVILAMRMIGEMAVLQPTPGGIADWPRRALGGWAGFTTGWLYWYSWIVVIAFEAVAAGEIVATWIDVPSGFVAPVLLLGILLANLTHVRAFGEMEY
ncbi:Amino acid permease [Micromonospora mirobrigensis]|uniref:Amino acid permease n=1 Tax=Micromonospora mirobrigensis TaxID=262898 RepID=A0A1C5ALB0_9ACTN|nr:Amino acid permease [Micromonospora mirobrigensis]